MIKYMQSRSKFAGYLGQVGMYASKAFRAFVLSCFRAFVLPEKFSQLFIETRQVSDDVEINPIDKRDGDAEDMQTNNYVERTQENYSYCMDETCINDKYNDKCRSVVYCSRSNGAEG